MKLKATFHKSFICVIKVVSVLSVLLSVCNCFNFREICDNKPNVTIISTVILSDQSIYVSTQTHYALIESITRDHLPIVTDGYPKLIDEEFKGLQRKHTNTADFDYEFVGNQYFLKAKHPNDRKFIGFNEVWIGCPQPLCLNGAIDAILKGESDDESALNIIIFRGKYFWEIGNYSKPPLVETARLVSERWESQELYPPVDAAFTAWNLNQILFAGNKTFKFGVSSSVHNITEHYKGIPNGVDAVMYWDTGSIDREILFVFKDQNVWALRNNEVMEGWPRNIKQLNKDLPDHISAALIDYNDTVYIFRDSSYYSFKSSQLEESNQLSSIQLMPRFVFKDIFNCSENLYSEWGFGSYSQFIHNYYSNPDQQAHPNDGPISPTLLDKIQKIFLKSNTDENFPTINWLIVLIAFASIITLSLIGVLVLIYCISRFKRKSDESRNIEILTAMRPLMNSSGNYFDIISIDELPKKGRKNSLKLNRTKLSDDAYG